MVALGDGDFVVTGMKRVIVEDEIAFQDVTLFEAGMTMDDVVSIQVFCTDLSLYEPFNAVYATYFHDNYPSRAFIGAGKLLFGARFEINGIAVARKKQTR